MSEHAPVRASYDDLAPTYDARWKKYIDATLALATEPLELTGDERLLDVACGTGELERQLCERWPRLRVTGIDVSPNMLRHAAEKDTGAALLAAEAHRLPFCDGSFDVVVTANAFHYFRRPDFSLAEMRRVLRPGGRLILADWCDDYLSCKLCSLWLRWTDPAFHQTYTKRVCRRMLEQSGFVVEAAIHRRIDWLWGLMCLECKKPG
jgi:ubiquinone/menaquinone biosynthesis C-methylase UbiE